MDVQTVLLLSARLACPLTIGAMLWFMLRQPGAGSDPSAEWRLPDLQRRHAAIDHQIKGSEQQAEQGLTAGNPT